MDVGAAMSKKYGPLPGSVWLLLVFAVAFIFMQSKKKSGSTGGGTTGDVAYQSGANAKTEYTTSSSTIGYYGPGAGGEFTGEYYAPGPVSTSINSGNTTTVDMPHPAIHTGTHPDHPSRHQIWSRPDGNQGWGDKDNHPSRDRGRNDNDRNDHKGRGNGRGNRR